MYTVGTNQGTIGVVSKSAIAKLAEYLRDNVSSEALRAFVCDDGFDESKVARKGKGKGGGQFAKKGEGGGASEASKKAKTKAKVKAAIKSAEEKAKAKAAEKVQKAAEKQKAAEAKAAEKAAAKQKAVEEKAAAAKQKAEAKAQEKAAKAEAKEKEKAAKAEKKAQETATKAATAAKLKKAKAEISAHVSALKKLDKAKNDLHLFESTYVNSGKPLTPSKKKKHQDLLAKIEDAKQQSKATKTHEVAKFKQKIKDYLQDIGSSTSLSNVASHMSHYAKQPNLGAEKLGQSNKATEGYASKAAEQNKQATILDLKNPETTRWTPQNATYDQKKSVGSYSGSSYIPINKTLRTKKRDFSDEDANADMHIKHIDSALDNSYTMQEGVFYRGAKGNTFNKWLNEGRIEPGEIITEWGYMSVSSQPMAANGFKGSWGSNKGVMFHVRIPKGFPAADISKISHVPGESETLAARGSRMMITKWDGQKRICYVDLLPPLRLKDRAHIAAGGVGKAEKIAV